MREREKKNRERNLKRGIVVSRERRDKSKYETKLEKGRIEISRRRREREAKEREKREGYEMREINSGEGDKFERDKIKNQEREKT